MPGMPEWRCVSAEGPGAKRKKQGRGRKLPAESVTISLPFADYVLEDIRFLWCCSSWEAVPSLAFRLACVRRLNDDEMPESPAPQGSTNPLTQVPCYPMLV